jgi:hypothetical protein
MTWAQMFIETASNTEAQERDTALVEQRQRRLLCCRGSRTEAPRRATISDRQCLKTVPLDGEPGDYSQHHP